MFFIFFSDTIVEKSTGRVIYICPRDPNSFSGSVWGILYYNLEGEVPSQTVFGSLGLNARGQFLSQVVDDSGMGQNRVRTTQKI